MSKQRTIKPSWIDDEQLAGASDAARVMSIAMILLADDFGNGRAGKKIAGRVFPGRALSVTEEALEELASASVRFAFFYELNGQRYYHIRKFDTHNRSGRRSVRTQAVPGPTAIPLGWENYVRFDEDGNCIPIDAIPVSGGENCTGVPTKSGIEVEICSDGSPPHTPPLHITDPKSGKFLLSEQNKLPVNLGSPPAQTKERPEDLVRRSLPEDWSPDATLVSILARRFQVTEEVLLRQVEAFRWYWREGGGYANRTTLRGWSQTFGNNIARLAKSGELYVERSAPGQRGAQREPKQANSGWKPRKETG